MVYLIMATIVAIFGISFARRATPGVMSGLTEFSQAAGFISRIFTTIDAFRVIAQWNADGREGPGPLTVPAPVQEKTVTVNNRRERGNLSSRMMEHVQNVGPDTNEAPF